MLGCLKGLGSLLRGIWDWAREVEGVAGEGFTLEGGVGGIELEDVERVAFFLGGDLTGEAG